VKIRLSDHFTYKKLLRFTLPSVLMMLFTSVYGVVDGLFVSNFAGQTAFASVNLILPYCYIFSAVGTLIGVGGSALVSLVRGQGDEARANRIFSMLVYAAILAGVALGALSELFLPSAARLLGADGEMLDVCVRYGRIFLLTTPVFILQMALQTFLVAAERPRLGLAFTVAAGVTNMLLDWLFIGVLRWGVTGAAAATCIGQAVGGIGPLLYFALSRTSPLRLGRTSFMPRALGRAAANGAAEFITSLSMSAVNMVFNLQLMRYIGEYGVSAYGIIMYVNFVFVAVYLGYAMGVGPAFSYHYGTGRSEELKSLFRKSLTLVCTSSLVLTAVAEATARPVATVFAGYDPAFLEISVRALRLYMLCYVFTGVGIFTSNLFAALNNGLIAGTLSALRIFVFQMIAVLLLPLALGSDGIWLSMPAAESGIFVLSVLVLIRQRKRYRYA